MKSNVYRVGSGRLTIEIVEKILKDNMTLELAPEAKKRIQKCRDYLDKKIAKSSEPLYGITTGFGSLCNKSISLADLGKLQENLIKSHSCSVGEEIRPEIVKLMLLFKAHALSLGHSGVQVGTVRENNRFFQ
jgi:histidine ammonia-lyase